MDGDATASRPVNWASTLPPLPPDPTRCVHGHDMRATVEIPPPFWSLADCSATEHRRLGSFTICIALLRRGKDHDKSCNRLCLAHLPPRRLHVAAPLASARDTEKVETTVVDAHEPAGNPLSQTAFDSFPTRPPSETSDGGAKRTHRTNSQLRGLAPKSRGLFLPRQSTPPLICKGEAKERKNRCMQLSLQRAAVRATRRGWRPQ